MRAYRLYIHKDESGNPAKRLLLYIYTHGSTRGGTRSILRGLQQCKTATQLEECVRGVTCGIARAFHRKRQGKTEGVVAAIRQIAETRYQEPLSIPMVAESVCLTPNYVSSVFKQETGKTFGEYLAAVRMEKAGELLRPG